MLCKASGSDDELHVRGSYSNAVLRDSVLRSFYFSSLTFCFAAKTFPSICFAKPPCSYDVFGFYSQKYEGFFRACICY